MNFFINATMPSIRNLVTRHAQLKRFGYLIIAQKIHVLLRAIRIKPFDNANAAGTFG